MYTDGSYHSIHPTWDVEDSPWKARLVRKLLAKHDLTPSSICEVGCGAGEVLRQLQLSGDSSAQYTGYEISPQAYALADAKSNERLKLILADICQERPVAQYDLLLALDVVEHVEDYLAFLRCLRPLARYKVFHFPLELSVQSVLRTSPIMSGRKMVGHLHYFMKDIVICALQETGYSIIDWVYTPVSIERPRSFRQTAMALPRRLLFKVSPDITVRILGGYSLMVLAE
jgi:SAM-dependent methyltransferase